MGDRGPPPPTWGGARCSPVACGSVATTSPRRSTRSSSPTPGRRSPVLLILQLYGLPIRELLATEEITDGDRADPREPASGWCSPYPSRPASRRSPCPGRAARGRTCGDGRGRRRRQHGRQGPQRPDRRAGHQQPGHRVDVRRRGRSQHRGEPRPARHPHPPRRRDRHATVSATRCWRRPPRPGCRSSTSAAAPARPAPTPPSSTPTATWSSRSPTWPPPTSSAPDAGRRRRRPGRRRGACVVLDGNLRHGDPRLRARPGRRCRRPGVLEPVSVPKAAALAPPRRPRAAALRAHPQPGRAGRADRPADRHRPRSRRGRARTPRPGCRAGLGPARRARARCSARPDGGDRSGRRPRRGRRRHRRRRRDARRLLPPADRRGRAGRGRGATPTRLPPSPSPARTPSDPTSPTVSSGALLMTHPDCPHPAHRRGRRRARRRPAGRRAREHDHQPRHALPAERRDGDRGRGHHPRARRRPGDHRCPPRPARASACPADQLELLASDGDVTKVSVRDLPFVVARGHARRDHGGRDDAARRARRDPHLRHRRARRRAPRRPADLRRERRPHRARHHRRRGRLAPG